MGTVISLAHRATFLEQHAVMRKTLGFSPDPLQPPQSYTVHRCKWNDTLALPVMTLRREWSAKKNMELHIAIEMCVPQR